MERARREAEATLEELDGAAALDGFRIEFQKLYEQLNRSHGNEGILATRITELAEDMKEHQRLREDTEQERNDLAAAKAQLEEELQHSLGETARVGTAAKQKEREITAVRERLAQLGEELDAGSGWTNEQLQDKQQCQEKRAELQGRLETKQSSLTALRHEVSVLQDHLKRAVSTKEDMNKAIEQLSADIEDRKRASVREQHRKDGMDERLRALQTEVEALQRRHGESMDVAQARAEELAAAQADMKAKEEELKRYAQEYDQVGATTLKLRANVDDAIATNEKLEEELTELQLQLQAKQREVDSVRASAKRVEQKHALALRHVDDAKQQMQQLQEQEAALKAEREAIDQQCDEQRQATRLVSKELARRIQERDHLRKSIAAKVDATKVVSDMAQTRTATSRTMEAEISGFRDGVRGVRDQIDRARVERDRFSAQCDRAAQQYFETVEAVKMKDLQITALQRQIAEQEAKLRGQQMMFESVRADRNMYRKQQVEAEAEIEAMKRQFDTQTFQVEQMKDEITSKDLHLVKVNFEHRKVTKEVQRINSELTTVRKKIESAEHTMASYEREVTKLQQIVKEADEEKARQEKELAAVLAERDGLQAQLVKRDDELSTLYEKLRVQKSALAQGAVQYAKRQQQVGSLRGQVGEVQREVEASKEQVTHVPKMEREATRLEEELLKEQAKARTLHDELQRPVNVHRWRALQINDPKRYKLIQRVNSLQKQINEMQAEVLKREQSIKEKEGAYERLKLALSRQPGAEAEEQITALRAEVKAKERQLKELKADLEANKAAADEHQAEVERLEGKMHKASKRFVRRELQARRQQQMQAHASAGLSGSLPQLAPGLLAMTSPELAAALPPLPDGDHGGVEIEDVPPPLPAAGVGAAAAAGAGGAAGGFERKEGEEEEDG